MGERKLADPVMLRWAPSPYEIPVVQEVREWIHTPYGLFGYEKGKAVDCVRFVLAVIKGLYKRPLVELEKFPPDTAMYRPRSARRAMRKILNEFPEHRAVDFQGGAEAVEAGDLIVTRLTPFTTSGPGHALIALGGGKVAHATERGVKLGNWANTLFTMHVYRATDREEWLR